MAGKKFQIPLVFTSDKKGITEAESALDGFKKKLGLIAGAVAAAFAINKIADFTKESILAAEGVATANARIEQIAKSTAIFGAETQKVTDRLIAFAEANEMRLAVDAEVIKGVQGQLLSFKALGASADTAGGAFDRATEAAFNMAAAGFGSAESNAVALGKALEDPIRGLTALRRSGTTFTEQQQEQIRVMQEAGDLAGAQNLILAELESQYGGVAEATANASDRMQLAFNNIKESVGAALLPVFNELSEALLPVINELGPQLASIFSAVMPAIKPLIPMFAEFIRNGLATMIPILQRVAEAFGPLIERLLPLFGKVIEAILPPLLQVMEAALIPLIDIVVMLFDAFAPLIETLLPIFSEILGALAPIVTTLFEAFMPLLQAILEPITDVIRTLVPIVVKLFDAFMPLIETLLPPLIQLFADIIDSALMPLLETIVPPLTVVMEGLGDVLLWLVDNVLGPLITGLKDVVKWLEELFKYNNKQVNFKVTGAVSSALSGTTIQAGRIPNRASGGGASNSGLSWVGERGPELISMPRGATVTPVPQHMRADALLGSNRGAGGNQVVYNISVSGGMGVDGAQLGEQIVTAIRKYERTSGAVFARA